MLNRTFASLLVTALIVQCGALHAAAGNSCQLTQVADLAINMDGRHTLLPARINGADAQFILGSDTFWSFLSLAATKQYGLAVNYSKMEGVKVQGAGEAISVGLTHVKDLTVFDVPFKHMDFIVAAQRFDPAAVGVIGQNVLGNFDIDYDLGHGRLRLFKPRDCDKSMLAYWARPADKVSLVKFDPGDFRWPQSVSTAYLDGEEIQVSLDSTANVSIVTLDAARRAGLTPQSDGVVPGGSIAGEGGRILQTWIGRFKSFKIGAEEIQNARLRFADIHISSDMLLGADFFLSHRIMVSNAQHQIYFTYGGGPVFDLRANPPASAGEAEPQDAAGYAQRGIGLAARGMPDRALADLDRACALAPDNAAYRLTRGEVRWHAQQVDAALDDFEQVLRAQPNNVEALLAHAKVKADARSFATAASDLDRLDTLLPPASEERVELASLNLSARRPANAIAQLDHWIPLHPDDRYLPEALNSRCWARALLSRIPDDGPLDIALKDCNSALHSHPDSAQFLDSRGLVYLRMGKWDLAIDDYNAALAKSPKQAWSLYGRGIAHLRKGLTTDGQADIDAATAADAHVVEDTRFYGIAP